jgi:hypothetical protein
MKTTASIRTPGMLLAITLTFGALPAPAQGVAPDQGRPSTAPSRTDTHTAQSFRRLRVPGEEVEQNVRRLTGELRWHSTLTSALIAGRAAGKPVVWIQALGDIDGFL